MSDVHILYRCSAMIHLTVSLLQAAQDCPWWSRSCWRDRSQGGDCQWAGRPDHSHWRRRRRAHCRGHWKRRWGNWQCQGGVPPLDGFGKSVGWLYSYMSLSLAGRSSRLARRALRELGPVPSRGASWGASARLPSHDRALSHWGRRVHWPVWRHWRHHARTCEPLAIAAAIATTGPWAGRWGAWFHCSWAAWEDIIAWTAYKLPWTPADMGNEVGRSKRLLWVQDLCWRPQSRHWWKCDWKLASWNDDKHLGHWSLQQGHWHQCYCT